MKDNTMIPFSSPELKDELSQVIQEGAQRLLAAAVHKEVTDYLAGEAWRRDAEGRQAVVRNGYLPQRSIVTGVGPVAVRIPKTRDRSGEGLGFHSALVPPYLKKTRRVEELLPVLYLTGVSTNDFDRALRALFGEAVAGLSAPSIARLKSAWEQEYKDFREADWHGQRFVYIWADGIYINVRAAERRCILVVIGCDSAGKKHFLAIEDGYRESKESWVKLLSRLKAHGLTIAPELAIGDGALGLWAALDEIFPTTRHQRCWVHKTANIMNALPKSVQPEAKAALHEIWQAPNRATAEAAFDRFIQVYEAKYPKAVQCLTKDREVLLAFYDFPAAHWQHIRTSNPIESSFATIRLRTEKTRNCVSAKSGPALVYKLAMSAEKRWRRLRGFEQLADVIRGIKFIDGIDERELSRKAA
jgi:transposase-like protein